MIRTEAVGDNVVLHGELPPGSIAFLDAEWIRRPHAGSVGAVIATEGALRWKDEPAVTMPDGVGAERAAARALSIVAQDAVTAVASLPSDEVEVAGDGFIARQIRRFIGRHEAKGASASSAPAAFIDTTGAPELIVAATRRLQDLGTLVLVGETHERLELDLYPDVHVRGLHVVGVPPPLSRRSPPDAPDEALEDEFDRLDGPAPVVFGTPVPLGASWYRVTSA